MKKLAGLSAFLLTALYVGTAFAMNPPGGGGGGVTTPEPSMLLYAASAIVPAWLFLRKK